MPGKVIFSILQESHKGPIGEDWRYWIEAKVFNQGLQGTGKISVAKHALPSGTTQQPPGPPAAVEIPAGEAGKRLLLKVRLQATEVDLFKNDVGETSVDFSLECPAAGEPAVVHEHDVSVGVVESPGIIGETSVFGLKIRFEASGS